MYSLLFIANLHEKYKEACEIKGEKEEENMEKILKDKENKKLFKDAELTVSESDSDES